MHIFKRAFALVLALLLVAGTIAFAAPDAPSTVNGTWVAPMNVRIAGVKIKSVRLVMQDGRAALSILGGNPRGTYTMLDGKRFNLDLNSAILGTTISDTFSYTVTNTKLTLKGRFLGAPSTLKFTRQVPKTTGVSANKVKLGDMTTLKVSVNSLSNFVKLTDAAGNVLPYISVSRSRNTFTFRLFMPEKKNIIYAQAGMFDIDGNASAQSVLSVRRKITVNCK